MTYSKNKVLFLKPARAAPALWPPEAYLSYYPFMLRALALAELSRGDTCPNPVVGAVLVRDGRIVAEGRHGHYGGPHAEVEVLRTAARAGINPAECTLVVTLEPCAHHGKTPPCCEAVLAAGIRHVVVGLADPTPRAGGGAACLRAAGVRVDMGVAEDLCARQLADFLFWQTSGLPFITLKLAASLDGAIATRTGESRWITGPTARRRVHELRSTAQGILVGGNTFRQDNPALTCRLTPGDDAEGSILSQPAASDLEFFPGFGRAGLLEAASRPQPLALVATSRLPEAGADYQLLRQRPAQTIFLTTAAAAQTPAADALRDIGASIIAPPPDFSSPDAPEESCGLSIKTMLHNLAALRRDFSCCRILCEGGGALGLFLLRHGLARFFELHSAPLIMGDNQAVRLFSGLNPERLADALRLRPLLQGRAGDDVITLWENRGGDPLDPGCQ